MISTKFIMGMPITIEVIDSKVLKKDLEEVFNFFRYIDKKFSPFFEGSDVFLKNRGIEIKSSEMDEILDIAQKTKRETRGFFDVWYRGKFDPSGIVKSWAIKKACHILKEKGYKNFYINCGGDIQVVGNKKWKVGIRDPFSKTKVVKKMNLENYAIATSGTYERGNHIYNPIDGGNKFDILSLTVLAEDILDADRFATAAFAMGKSAIYFLEQQKNLEAYMIDKEGIATMTSGFDKFVAHDD